MDEGPAECDICQKVFKLRKSMLRHRTDKHGERVPCPAKGCPHTFPAGRQASIDSQVARKHPWMDKPERPAKRIQSHNPEYQDKKRMKREAWLERHQQTAALESKKDYVMEGVTDVGYHPILLSPLCDSPKLNGVAQELLSGETAVNLDDFPVAPVPPHNTPDLLTQASLMAGILAPDDALKSSCTVALHGQKDASGQNIPPWMTPSSGQIAQVSPVIRLVPATVSTATADGPKTVPISTTTALTATATEIADQLLACSEVDDMLVEMVPGLCSPVTATTLSTTAANIADQLMTEDSKGAQVDVSVTASTETGVVSEGCQSTAVLASTDVPSVATTVTQTNGEKEKCDKTTNSAHVDVAVQAVPLLSDWAVQCNLTDDGKDPTTDPDDVGNVITVECVQPNGEGVEESAPKFNIHIPRSAPRKLEDPTTVVTVSNKPEGSLYDRYHRDPRLFFAGAPSLFPNCNKYAKAILTQARNYAISNYRERVVSVVPEGTNSIQRTETALFADGRQYITEASWTAKPGFKIKEIAQTQTEMCTCKCTCGAKK